MKLISWNVNGIRAAMGKGFLEFVSQQSPDIMCVQETKMQEGQAEVPVEGYHQYWGSAKKKGILRYGSLFKERADFSFIRYRHR